MRKREEEWRKIFHGWEEEKMKAKNEGKKEKKKKEGKT